MARPSIFAALACFIVPIAATAQPNVGDISQILFSYETSTEEAGVSDGYPGGRSSTSGQSGLIETVLAVRPDGIELEFDLPADVSIDQRAPVWRYPARVMRPEDGPMLLLNEAELQQRIDERLAAANIPQTVCGAWYFTWNTFQIECDPHIVIEELEAIDLRLGELQAGDLFTITEAANSNVLREVSSGNDGIVLQTDLILDPERAANSRAETARVVAEIMGQDVTQSTASADDISGTITITLFLNPAGNVYRRVVNIEQRVALPNGGEEIGVATYTTERRPLNLE